MHLRPKAVLITAICMLAALRLAWATTTALADDDGLALQRLMAPGEIEFGLVGKKGPQPMPTAFIFANDIENTLTSDDYNRCGKILVKNGFLCVGLDLPCHGADAKTGEPGGLDGWCHRLRQGENVVEKFCAKSRALLDYLIAEGYTDANRVVACGTSRGGFIALHFAASEPRVKSVVAFAPVTDLLALREFDGQDNVEAITSLALARHAEKLATRKIWLCIGNYDERVDTDLAIDFTRRVVRASVEQKVEPDVELHVMTSRGHSIHKTAHPEAAQWLLEGAGRLP